MPNRLTYKGRLYPTPAQRTALNAQMDASTRLYNRLLAITLDNDKPLSNFTLNAQITHLKRTTMPELLACNAQALQNVARRLDQAWLRYYKGMSDRPVPKDTVVSMSFPQYRTAPKDGRVRVSKLGWVRARGPVPVDGDRVKCLTVWVDLLGDWFYGLTVEQAAALVYPARRLTAVGVDLGLATFATLSNGERHCIPTPTPEQLRERIRLRRNPDRRYLHHMRRWRRRRQDFMHKLSRRLVDRWDIIVVEKLDIARMSKYGGYIGQRVARAGWGRFLTLLEYKAERAGREVIKVSPAYTSKDCSICGWRADELTLSDRVLDCERCGCGVDRDLGAARNILRRGLK
jgi:putative transposase